MAPAPDDQDLQRAVRIIEEAEQKHGEFVEGVERRYKSYRGILDSIDEAAQWTSKLHPPYINHIVETTLASLIDDKFRYRIRPRLTMESILDPQAAQRADDGARAHQILFDWQVRKDRFSQIQRAFNLQHAIAGLTVAKTYWTQRQERRRRLVPQEVPLEDDNGPLIHPLTGEQLTMPQMVEVEGDVIVYDGPTTEVRDVRDFMWWPESAVSIEKAGAVIDRVWLRPDEVLEGFAEGQFGPDRGGWSEADVKDALVTSADYQSKYATREQDLFNVDRTKDLIEVCEVWDNRRGVVTTIANRSAVLANRPYPFFHNRPPFVVCSTQPDLFRIPGISQVEKVEHLQQMLWTLMNQRIDNLQLINNAIFWFRPDVEDVDAYEFEPGARWPVDDPTQVQMWAPNVIPAEVSLNGEALLKGDMQNLAGGFPFSSGTDSANVDQKTATGAALITNIAQRSIDLSKQQVNMAFEEIGYQRMVLNTQFVREPTVAPVLGVNDEEELHIILPEILQGDFDFELEPVPDAMMKQEEQASAQGLAQVLAGLAPILVPLSQGGLAKMINFDAIIEDLLRAFGKDNVERYFVSSPPPALPQGGPQGALPPGQPQSPAPQGTPMGITGPNSINPAVSPSAQASVAPSTLMQRAIALAKGGGRNVPS